jgi:hypothetical protein
MKTITNIIYLPFALFAFACFTLLPAPKAFGVVPAPDGGYPNFTTAEGTDALKNLTNGVGYTATGWHSLFANTAGNLNTATGAGTLLFNTGDNNTATGALALLSNTGSFNTALGSQTLVNNTGFLNTAVGYQALVYNTTSETNTAVGCYSQYSNNSGGGANTSIGYKSLYNNTGAENIGIGQFAGNDLTIGERNICIGNEGVAGEGYTTRIGTYQTAIYLAGIAGQTVGQGGSTWYVDNDGKLGVFLSASRFKTDIADMGNASEALLALRPVTFHYKPELDKNAIPQFGLVAEEVAKVNPDLVTHDAKGELYTVRYEAINAMLLNEFLKEHKAFLEEKRKVRQLEANAGRQQKQIETLTSGLQKVSAQLELSKPAPAQAVSLYERMKN